MRGNRIAFRARIAGRLPAHIRDVIRRPQVRRGIAMAIEAEVHRERLGPIGQRHLINAAMAAFAADALGDVNVMAKKDIVRKLRYSGPLIGLFSARLCRTGSSIDAVVQIWEWQVMHVSVGGKPACGAVSTPVWQ